MITLGIDPGTATTGYGIVKEEKGKMYYIDCGVILTDKNLSASRRLLLLRKEMLSLIKEHSPDILSIESLFFLKNIKTALPVSQSRGVILLTAEEKKLFIYEFTPLEIKQTITGYGKADKKQVQEMIKNILGLKELPKEDDAADALAAAICGLLKASSPLS